MITSLAVGHRWENLFAIRPIIDGASGDAMPRLAITVVI